MDLVRRRWLATACSVGAGAVLVGCSVPPSDEEEGDKEGGKPASGEVSAPEDLMREHGVLRRALMIYQETAVKLAAVASSVDPDALQKTAKLIRVFGEDYHEQKLEEAHIFPAVQKAGGLTAAYVGVLTAQHQRGREITDYILSMTLGNKFSALTAETLSRVLQSFVRMYEHHTAIEDTVIFPAWKQTMTIDQMDQMGDRFEQIEARELGEGGYEEAVKRVSDIEASLGLGDLGQFTALPPPQTKETKAPPEKGEPEKTPQQTPQQTPQ
jgi:hemerythrin-like domain-containing protein